MEVTTHVHYYTHSFILMELSPRHRPCAGRVLPGKGNFHYCKFVPRSIPTVAMVPCILHGNQWINFADYSTGVWVGSNSILNIKFVPTNMWRAETRNAPHAQKIDVEINVHCTVWNWVFWTEKKWEKVYTLFCKAALHDVKTCNVSPVCSILTIYLLSNDKINFLTRPWRLSKI